MSARLEFRAEVAAGRAQSPHTSMFVRMLVRAAVLRRGRAASALFAMVVAAAVATAMLNLYVDVQAKLRREFRNYGANIILVGKDGASLPAGCSRAGGIGARRARRGRSFCVGRGANQRWASRSLLLGTDFDRVRQLDRWWSVSNWPSAAAAGAGRRARDSCGLAEEPALRPQLSGTHHSPHARWNGADWRCRRQPRLSFARGLRFVDRSSAFYRSKSRPPVRRKRSPRSCSNWSRRFRQRTCARCGKSWKAKRACWARLAPL